MLKVLQLILLNQISFQYGLDWTILVYFFKSSMEKQFYSSLKVNEIKPQFQGLKMTYQNEEILNDFLDGCGHTDNYNKIKNR